MSVCALLANFLFIFDYINPDAHEVNISILTNGAFSRDLLSLESYTFPYGLGFILTGDGQLNFLGIDFIRISGWAHEPTSATLFVSPALLLLFHENIITNQAMKFVMIISIGAFWFLALSVGSFLAFAILYSIVFFIYIYKKFFHKSKTMVIIFLSMILLIPFSFVYLGHVFESALFSSKFNLDSHTFNTAFDQLKWFMPDSNKDLLSYTYHLFLWVIIFTFFLSSIFFLTHSQSNKVYAMILLYIIIHSMKGSQTTVFYLIFTYFWLYITYFSSIYKPRN